MLRVNIEQGTRFEIVASGSALEMLNDLLSVINATYTSWQKYDTRLAGALRVKLLEELNRPESKVWEAQSGVNLIIPLGKGSDKS